jgi:hypothetical protein
MQGLLPHSLHMENSAVDPSILELCAKVTAKRARAVIDHILQHGGVSTDELQDMGYTHPPRAARDVREQGIPLETYKVRSEKSGRMIGAYRFADPATIKGGRIGGRRAFSKAFKEALIERYGSADTISSERLDPRYLQIDHRIPYEVAGDSIVNDLSVENYMLLDASNQRAKSWSCERCENWRAIHDPEICKACYWAFPESYKHVAMQPERRVDVVWQGDETRYFDAAKMVADGDSLTPAQLIKRIIRQMSGE